MLKQPIKGDLGRALSLLMHESRHKLLDECNSIKSHAALRSNRIIISAAKTTDTLHQEAMKQAAAMLLDFIERMQPEPAEIIEWASSPRKSRQRSAGLHPPQRLSGGPPAHSPSISRGLSAAVDTACFVILKSALLGGRVLLGLKRWKTRKSGSAQLKPFSF